MQQCEFGILAAILYSVMFSQASVTASSHCGILCAHECYKSNLLTLVSATEQIQTHWAMTSRREEAVDEKARTFVVFGFVWFCFSTTSSVEGYEQIF